MNNFVVSSRDLQRNYGGVIQRVQQTNQAAVLTSQNEPQAVIVPVERYKKLEQLERSEALERLVELSKQIAEEFTDNSLPSDMSANHDKYFAEAVEADLERIHTQYDHNR